MTSVQAQIAHSLMWLVLGRRKFETVMQMRELLDMLNRKAERSVKVQPIHIGEQYAEWLTPADARPNSAILYLHGGAYIAGSCNSHRHFVSYLAQVSRIPTLLINYRLAPENPFPAALDDAVNAYQSLIDQGYPPENILIAGDSAGGGLTLATLLKLRDEAIPLPAGAMCISPFTDLQGTGESLVTRQKLDPWLKSDGVPLVIKEYAPDVSAQNPYVSPLYGDYAGLPPLLIQVGDHEILLSDSERVAAKARAAGVQVDLKVWDYMWHVWHSFYQYVPESRAAIRQMADFAAARVGSKHAGAKQDQTKQSPQLHTSQTVS